MIRRRLKPATMHSDLPPTAELAPPDYSAVCVTRPEASSFADGFGQWYRLSEQEFAHLRGGINAPPAHADRGAPASFKWGPALTAKTSEFPGSSRLSRAWRAVAGWCLDMGKPKPLAPDAAARRQNAALVALSSLSSALSINLGDDVAALDFQAFV